MGWVFLVENPLITLNILLSPSILFNRNLLFVLVCLCNCLLNCIRIMNSIRKTSKLFFNISRPRAFYHLSMFLVNEGEGISASLGMDLKCKELLVCKA